MTGSSFTDWVIRLILIFLFVFVWQVPISVEIAPTEGTRRDLPVEAIEVVAVQPDALELIVSGTDLNDCQVPVQVDYQLDGQMIMLQVYQIIPENARCTRGMFTYRETVRLEGAFEVDAVYTFSANGIEIQP